jgi:hypothetical protein
MKLSDAKRKALVLMREYTVGGNPVESPDYSKSMDDLANAAQNEIAQKLKIPASYTLPSTGDSADSDYTYFNMPSDFSSIGTIIHTANGARDRNPIGYCFWKDRKTLAVSTDVVDDAWTVNYYKRPTQIIPNVADDKANDNMEFEIDPEGQELIPLYIAAQLLVDEDPGRSVNLMNLYYGRLEQLQTNDAPLMTTVRNVLGW